MTPSAQIDVQQTAAAAEGVDIATETPEVNQDYTPEPEAVQAYEDRKQDKRDRYAEIAARASNESSYALNRAHRMAEFIPFGQPILVGHHSEKRDRNYRGKIHSLHSKGFELASKADHYAAKAENYGENGVISGDDPAAIIKLQAELDQCQQVQDSMKAANKIIKSKKTPADKVAALVALGFPEAKAESLIVVDQFNRLGFPSYRLTNNNANIKRIAQRIASLKAIKSRVDVEEVAEGYTYREDTTENRIMFVFEGKPNAQTITILKSNAFKWSPTRGAWVRQITNNALWAARSIKKELNALGSVA
jgi:hypothetical protein